MSNQDTIKKLGAVVNENLPHILTGVAAVGVVTTAIESAKAALKINDMDTNEEDDRKASEKAKSVFFALLPPVVSGALTLGCLISSDVVHTKRYTSLLGAFVLAKGELPKYKEELAKIVSPEKKKEIERQMAENRVKENTTVEAAASRYLDESKYVKHRVVDLVTGATLKASYAALLRGETEVAKEIARTGHCTLETFYSFVTDEADYPEIATRIYWDQEERRNQMDLHIGAEIEPETGEMYYTIDYEYETR